MSSDSYSSVGMYVHSVGQTLFLEAPPLLCSSHDDALHGLWPLFAVSLQMFISGNDSCGDCLATYSLQSIMTCTVYCKEVFFSSVVHPDPDTTGTEIICKLGSGSGINSGSGFGFGSGFKVLFCFPLTNTKL